MKNDSSLQPPAPRRFERCRIDAPVACLRDEGLCFETAVEISEGGMLMLVQHDYKIGETLDLRFFIPGQMSVAIRGEVAYAMDSLSFGPFPSKHVGIRFLDNPETLAPSLRTYISKVTAHDRSPTRL